MKSVSIAAGLFLAAFSAVAAEATCPELTALQRFAGYLSWMGLFQVIGVVTLTAGVMYVFRGVLAAIWDGLWAVIRDIADVLAHAFSLGLVVAGAWVPEEYRLWPVLSGCLLFAGSVFFTIWLRKLKGDNPAPVYGLLTFVWGCIAIYYGMPEVGFIAVAALMGLLGYSIVVTPFCYGFGFRDEPTMVRTTSAALVILVFYALAQLFPSAVPAISAVFATGAFWLGSLVAFTGLLIISNKLYFQDKHDPTYVWMQAATLVVYLGGTAYGMIFGINALAGMAGIFLVLYAAAKLVEVETNGHIAFGFKLMAIGGIFAGAWWYATAHQEAVMKYLTTTLPA